MPPLWAIAAMVRRLPAAGRCSGRPCLLWDGTHLLSCALACGFSRVLLPPVPPSAAPSACLAPKYHDAQVVLGFNEFLAVLYNPLWLLALLLLFLFGRTVYQVRARAESG